MRITFLGTGTSQGIPMIACPCEVCASVDKRDKRLRSSVLVEINGLNIVIDTGPDFRYQMLREQVKHLEAILFTHEHKDHIAGLDDVRAFNYFQQRAVDVYGTNRVLDALKREFAYAFSDQKYPGIPQIDLHDIANSPFLLNGDVLVSPIQVMHYKLPILGFRIGDFTYITDAKTIDEQELEKIKGSTILVLNALQQESHISHLTLEEAITLAQKIGAKETYLTHIGHRLGKHADVLAQLPTGIFLAYDGLKVNL
ncbi:phosphoribosyl 1,2-cyclic phosphate phosphodiesterase [bacterium A37T11]|nr:phosphoribosyl 1,2-cyclic phosphate phosphodiesterase [bacterium A37T11]